MTKCLPGPGGPTVCAHALEPRFPISKGHSHCQFAKNHPPGLAESIRRGDERPCLIGRPFSSAAPLVIPPSSPQRVNETFHAWQDTSTGVFTPCAPPLLRTPPPANRCTRNEHRYGAGYVITVARSALALSPGLDGSLGAHKRREQEEFHQRPGRRELSQGCLHGMVLSVELLSPWIIRPSNGRSALVL